MWRGALWLPYRRETWVLERAMAQAVAAAGEGKGEPLLAIFMHADVVGGRAGVLVKIMPAWTRREKEGPEYVWRTWSRPWVCSSSLSYLVLPILSRPPYRVVRVVLRREAREGRGHLGGTDG